MKKYFGWLFALVASMTMVSAYADDVSDVEDNDEPLAVVIDDDAEDDQADE